MPTLNDSIRIVRQLALEHDAQAFFQLAASEAARLVGADGAALLEQDAPGQLRYRFFQGLPAAYQTLTNTYRLPIGKGTVGAALRRNKPLFTPDYPNSPNALPEFIQAGLKANLILPIGSSGRVLAALSLAWFKQPPPSPPDAPTLALLGLIADLISTRFYYQVQADHLSEQALRDTLTRLPNRRALDKHLPKALARCRRTQGAMALVMLDLDDFKQINDVYGHAAGDMLLQQLAERLQATLRSKDYVARLGGDEFVLLLERIADPAALLAMLERISVALTPAYTLPGGGKADCLASLGVTVYPYDDGTADDLLRHADRALYQAKSHKSRRQHSWVLYASLTHKSSHRRGHELVALLPHGVELHYQPIIDVRRASVLRLEVLARLRDGDTLHYPPAFLPLFDDHARHQLFDAVLNQALTQLQAWQSAGFRTDISINIDPHLLLDTQLPTQILSQLLHHQLEPGRLTLEILESGEILNQAETLQQIHALHALGVRLAIDDLGTAYASLLRLRDLPIQEIKLDQVFVRELDSQVNDLPFALSIKDLANGLDVELVAEGVETPTIRALLSSLGIHLMQGHGLCQPQPADSLLAAIEAALARIELPVETSLLSVYARHLSIESSLLNLLEQAPQLLSADKLANVSLCPLMPMLQAHPQLQQLHARQHALLGWIVTNPLGNVHIQIKEYRVLGQQIRHLLAEQITAQGSP